MRARSVGFRAGGKMDEGQTILGKYRVNALLGMGGMASVWSATNIFTGREFAIKFMLPEMVRTAEAVHRFLLEAKVTARINHPNIVEVIDVGKTEDGALFLLMELLNGNSLDSALLCERPPMRVLDFLLAMRDVANALAAAHQAAIVHRDLKPTNVFLHRDRSGRRIVKVLDFGVSKILEEGADPALTLDGAILGSPLYMSPEQALGEETVDGRTDVFAFGAMMFEALCGQRAYDASNLNALLVAIATTPPKEIDEVAPQLPEPLRALVRDCLATERARRLDSFKVVVQRLQPIILSLVESDLRLPPCGSQHPSDSFRASVLSSSRPASGIPSSTRQATSVAPHSSPTPNAPAALPRDAAFAHDSVGRGWAEDKGRSLAWFGAGAVAGVALLVGVEALFGRRGGAWPWSANTVPSTDTCSSRSQPIAPLDAESSLVSSTAAVIAVDSAAARSAATIDGNGRLSIATAPGWCSISVDGIARGVTPLASFELAAGPHKIVCVSPDGTAKTASVTVTEGGETRYQFAIAE